MSSLLRLFTSKIGKKYIVAITGAALVLFTIVHMLGNLQVFLGPDTINSYAHLLKSRPEVLWFFRVGLLAAVILHIWGTITLAIDNRAARPVKYEYKETIQASSASRTMVYSGVIVLSFIIYHLAHFTVQVTHPEYKSMMTQIGGVGPQVPDVYSMVIRGFQNLWVSGFYILSVGLLCWHMSHGISSMFQSVGWRGPKTSVLFDRLAFAISMLIFLGMSIVPIAILLGYGGS